MEQPAAGVCLPTPMAPAALWISKGDAFVLPPPATAASPSTADDGASSAASEKVWRIRRWADARTAYTSAPVSFDTVLRAIRHTRPEVDLVVLNGVDVDPTEHLRIVQCSTGNRVDTYSHGGGETSDRQVANEKCERRILEWFAGLPFADFETDDAVLSPLPPVHERTLLLTPSLRLSILDDQSAEDCAHIFTLLNSDGWKQNIAVMSHVVDPTSAAAYISARPHALYRSCGCGVLLLEVPVVSADDGSSVTWVRAGVAGLIQRDAFKGVYDVGYALQPSFYGRGLATTAVQHLLQYAYYVLGEERIAAVLRADNVASLRVLARAGFPTNEPTWVEKSADGHGTEWFISVPLTAESAASAAAPLPSTE